MDSFMFDKFCSIQVLVAFITNFHVSMYAISLNSILCINTSINADVKSVGSNL